jgi:nucleotide-binding universal stress UspA family protein
MLTFKKILCPTDFSETSYQALDKAIVLCQMQTERTGSVELCLLHVVSPAPISVPAAPYGSMNIQQVAANHEALNRAAEAAAGQKLQSIMDARVPQSVSTKVLTGCGDSALEILRIAEEEGCDLIITGTHGVTGWRHLVLGSVTEEVVRLAPCPVLTVGPKQHAPNAGDAQGAGPQSGGAQGNAKILCPIDFSDASLLALAQAGELVAGDKTPLYLLHVMEKLDPALGIISDLEFDDSRSADVLQTLAPLIDTHVPEAIRDDVKRNTLVREGNPAREIVRVAGEQGFSLIVMATRGQTGWRHLMFGSVAEEVVRTAPCPVLTVRARNARPTGLKTSVEPTPTEGSVAPPDAAPIDAAPLDTAPSNVDPHHVSEADFPTSGNAADKLRFLLNYAVLAPSTRNTQPWLWKENGDYLELYADRSRALPVIDPDGCSLIMSCGATLFLLRTAIRHFGYEDDVHYFPDMANHDLLARITLGKPYQETPEEQALFAAITRRRTDRMELDDRELAPKFREDLETAAVSEGARLHFVEPAARESIINLIEYGDMELGHNKRYREEVAQWTRSNESDRQDGIPGYALGMNNITSMAAPYLIRALDMGGVQARKDRALAENAGALVTLVTEKDTPQDWLTAGQALARVLLRACADDVYASFLNAPLEVADMWPRLRRLLGLKSFPQLLFRLGYDQEQDEVNPTPRRPVSEVLRGNTNQ